ncbi:MAG: tetratricopeptide repeat protein [Phenylobacterium sp.]|nr:tetratricopeptide repeat protein [Phenylobacterium sp.]
MNVRRPIVALAALAAMGVTPAFAQTEEPTQPVEVAACLDTQNDDIEAGIAACTQALALAETDDVRASVLLVLSLYHHFNGDIGAADAAADQAAALDPVDEVLSMRADMRTMSGRPEAALALIEADLRQTPNAPTLQRNRLLTLARLGRAQEARSGLERLHRQDPDRVQVTLALANVYIALGEDSRSARLLDAAIVRAPTDGDLRLRRGETRLWAGDYAGATEDLNLGLTDEGFPADFAMRAAARIMSGDVEGARGDLATIGDPSVLGAASALYALRASSMVGDYARALIFADVAVEAAASPDMATALVHRGEVRVLSGLLTEAQADFEKAAVLEPQNARAWGGLGRVVLESDPAQAAIFYGRAATLAPSVPDYQAGVAEAANRLGDHATAGAEYDKLIRALPGDHTLRAARAQVFMAEGRFEEALAASTEAVRLAPDDEETLLGHVEALAVAGDSPAALALLDRLTARGAESPTSRYLAALILRNQGDYERALREAEAGLVLSPEDPDLIEEKGTIYYLLDDPLSARDWLDKALALNPSSADAFYLRALVRGELGDTEGAAADQAAAIALDPSLAEEL